jgi:hypothetical protein
MTIQAQVSVYPQVFVPRDYDVFAGLDVDHHSDLLGHLFGRAAFGTKHVHQASFAGPRLCDINPRNTRLWTQPTNESIGTARVRRNCLDVLQHPDDNKTACVFVPFVNKRFDGCKSEFEFGRVAAIVRFNEVTSELGRVIVGTTLVTLPPRKMFLPGRRKARARSQQKRHYFGFSDH